jgi:hypothetical protein
MGIFYGDIHYGIKISKKRISEDSIFIEPIHELKFDDNSILLNDYLDKVKYFYLSLLEPDNYQYEVLVDIFTTHDGVQSFKGWQQITIEQMNNFINGEYTINFLQNDTDTDNDNDLK